MNGLHRLLTRAAATLCIAIGCHGPAAAQSVEATQRLLARLQALGVLDSWMQREVLAAAMPLVQASGGRFSGVQVNDFPRPGWLSIYLVDSARMPDDAAIADGGVALGREQLSAGAWTHGESGTILLDTAYWKRLTAATLMTQRKSPAPLPQALATVDARGLSAVRPWWDEAGLMQDTPENRGTGMLIRGAVAYALAHEMGHVGQASSRADGAGLPSHAPPRSDPRLRDRAGACDEFRRPEDEAQRNAEREADRHAARLIGQLCRVPGDGPIRHQTTALGASWFMTAALADKVIAMGFAKNRTPTIDRAVQILLGADLHAALAARDPTGPTRGVIALAFPSSHPPDTDRMQAFERELAATPCGASGLVTAEADRFEAVRLRMCQSLKGAR